MNGPNDGTAHSCTLQCDHDTIMVQEPVPVLDGTPHPRCEQCLTRAQKRAFKKTQRRRTYACCAMAPDGRRNQSRGKHNHSRASGAMDHATGTNYWSNDPSTTRAVKNRLMRGAEVLG